MKNILIFAALAAIRLAAGRLGREILGWVEMASRHGLEGRAAFDFVWRKAKTRHGDIGDWLLNMLIEALAPQPASARKSLLKKLKWPKKLIPGI